MDEKEANEYVKKGWLYTSIVFELIGNPKEYVEKALKVVLDSIHKNENLKIVGYEIGDPEEVQGGMWGAFCDSEILVKDLITLNWVATNFSPASIEIIEPTEITLKDKQLTDIYGDFLSHIHAFNTTLIDLRSKSKTMQKNINAVVRNSILVSLVKESKPVEDISKMIGISVENIMPVLDAMIKENKLELVENKYKRK